VQFVQTFMQQRGLNPAQVFGQGQQVPNGQAPQPEMHPQLQTLQQRLDTIEADRQREIAARQQQVHSANLSQVDAFAADPKHIYFQDVSDDMLPILKDLRERNPAMPPHQLLEMAYTKACRVNDAVFAQINAQQSVTQTDPASVDAARRAQSANLNGSPVPGASSQQADQNEDLRATLERNYRAAAGGARV